MMTLWLVVVGFVAYGVSSCVFAFVNPPGWIAWAFQVRRGFIFLPDRWAIPASRVFVGLMFLVAAVVVAIKVVDAG
jgi:hypothetical protein